MNPTRSQLFAAALVALLVVPGTALGVVTGSPDLSADVAGGPLEPGAETNLTVQLQNSGRVVQGSTQNPALNSRVTTARSVAVSLRSWDDAPVTVETGTVFLGSIPDGGVSTADFGVSVDENATPGTYTFQVAVEYDYTSYISETEGGQDHSSRSRNYYVDVRIEESASFEVVDVRSDVLVGDEGTVSATIRNTGSQAADDAAVTLTSPNADVTLGGGSSASRYVGTWAPGENRTVTFDAAVAARAGQQPYTLQAQVDYENADGTPVQSEALATRLVPEPEQRFRLAADAGSLQVGRDGSVEGTVTNEGPRAVRAAVLRVDSQASGVTFEDREYALGTLPAGESANFSLPVELSDEASAGQRQFSYTVEYRNGDNDTVQSRSLTSQVSVEPQQPLFDVIATNASVKAGGSETVTLTVTNNADETLRNIDAKAFVDDPLTLSNAEGFIPELAPGESAEFSVEVSSDGAALPRTYALSVDFQYEDGDYETKLSDTYAVGVEVVEASGNDRGFVLPLVGLVAALAVAALAVVWYRRR